jgi:internalin A
MKTFWYTALPAVLLFAGTVRAGDEDETVAAIKKLGGTVIHFDNDSKKPVQQVFLPGKKVMDADLKQLANLPKLELLHLSGASKITDEGVKHLAGLKQLTNLSLASTQLTDAGLKQLTGLTELKKLSLSFTKITDAGVPDLSMLKGLEELGLPFTEVSADGVKKLQEALPKCKIIK